MNVNTLNATTDFDGFWDERTIVNIANLEAPKSWDLDDFADVLPPHIAADAALEMSSWDFDG